MARAPQGTQRCAQHRRVVEHRLASVAAAAAATALPCAVKTCNLVEGKYRPV